MCYIGVDGCSAGWFMISENDILDAIVLYLAAKLSNKSNWELVTIPAEPEIDPEGIRMEIVFTIFGK